MRIKNKSVSYLQVVIYLKTKAISKLSWFIAQFFAWPGFTMSFVNQECCWWQCTRDKICSLGNHDTQTVLKTKVQKWSIPLLTLYQFIRRTRKENTNMEVPIIKICLLIQFSFCHKLISQNKNSRKHVCPFCIEKGNLYWNKSSFFVKSIR